MKVEIEKASSSFLATGFASLGAILGVRECTELLNQIRSASEFSRALFKTEKEFRSGPDRRGLNPAPGRNILEHLDTTFLEEHAVLHGILTTVLGMGYEIVNKKAVVAIPGEWIPEWVKREIRRLPVPNLGVFVKPRHANISYFYGIPFHQDIIDYQERYSDFVTVYVYLNKVHETQSPLHVIPNSHRFGATLFPHHLEHQARKGKKDSWTYSDGCHQEACLASRMLCGPAGSVYLWHPCILHGTLPSKLTRSARSNRVSLRYIVAKRSGAARSLLDKLNDQIQGPLQLENQHEDGAEARAKDVNPRRSS